MKLYVCWGLHKFGGIHCCYRAYDALRKSGHNPELVKCYGWKALPDFLNQTPGRKEVKRLTGNTAVPVLVTDSGEVIQTSQAIIDWAEKNPVDKAPA